MKITLTLWAKNVLREPPVIDKNLGGSRTPKFLILLLSSGILVTGGMIRSGQVTGSRKSQQNMQKLQAL
jgi:hypothetical protein